MKPKRMLAAVSILVLSMFGTSAARRVPQEDQYRLAHANGEGTLKVGQEQFKVNAVVVKLLNDKKAEITLVADITLFLTGTWTQNAESQESFDLQITGGAAAGGLEGTGKVTLGNDPKDLRLSIKGKSRTSKRTVEVHFVGK